MTGSAAGPAPSSGLAERVINKGLSEFDEGSSDEEAGGTAAMAWQQRHGTTAGPPAQMEDVGNEESDEFDF